MTHVYGRFSVSLGADDSTKAPRFFLFVYIEARFSDCWTLPPAAAIWTPWFQPTWWARRHSGFSRVRMLASGGRMGRCRRLISGGWRWALRYIVHALVNGFVPLVRELWL